MFSFCTCHQSEQNGFLSRPQPFLSHSSALLTILMEFMPTKKMTMPPIIRGGRRGCSHTYMDVCVFVYAGCVPPVGYGGAGVLDVKGFVELSVHTNICLFPSVMLIMTHFSCRPGSAVHLVPPQLNHTEFELLPKL